MQLLSIGGVPLRVRPSFLSSMSLMALFVLLSQDDLDYALRMLGTAGITIVSVLVHEYGHACVAKRLGLKVEDVVLHVCVGMTRMEAPRTPREEIFIGLAGPLSNLSIAALLSPLALRPESFDGWWPVSFPAIAFGVNLILGAVNLFPAFPMDGGRILRATLATSMKESQATSIAVRIGRILATILIASPLLLDFIPQSFLLSILGIIVMALGEMEVQRVARHQEEIRLFERLQAKEVMRQQIGETTPEVETRD